MVADSIYVLDTSAMLTLMEDEQGADRVQEILTVGTVLVPWIVLLEAYYVSYQERGREEADRRYALMKRLPSAVDHGTDEPVLLIAGRLKASRHLSLADAVIAAVALVRGATLVHKDPEYEAVADEVRLEALPYKGTETVAGRR